MKNKAMDWKIRGFNPGRDKWLFSRNRPAVGSTQLPIQWEPGFFPGGKRQGREVDHSPPSKRRS
jgi:hypothetical protein